MTAARGKRGGSLFPGRPRTGFAPAPGGGACAAWAFRLSVGLPSLAELQTADRRRQAWELQGWRPPRRWSCRRAPGSRQGWRGPGGARTPLLAAALAPRRGPAEGVGAGLAKSRCSPAAVRGAVGFSPQWFTYLGLQCFWQLGSVGRCVWCVSPFPECGIWSTHAYLSSAEKTMPFFCFQLSLGPDYEKGSQWCWTLFYA